MARTGQGTCVEGITKVSSCKSTNHKNDFFLLYTSLPFPELGCLNPFAIPRIIVTKPISLRLEQSSSCHGLVFIPVARHFSTCLFIRTSQSFVALFGQRFREFLLLEKFIYFPKWFPHPICNAVFFIPSSLLYLQAWLGSEKTTRWTSNETVEGKIRRNCHDETSQYEGL